MLALVSGLFFSSCQTEDVSEATTSNDLNAKIEKTKSNPQVSVKIHEPVWLDGPGAYIHEPVFLSKNSFFECGPLYDGGPTLTVTRNSEISYTSGTDNIVELKNLGIGGDFYFCGELAVENTVNVHWAGVFNMAGELTVGTHEKPADLVITHGGHLNLMGHVVVTGDLILNDGATIAYKEGNSEEVDFEEFNLIDVEGDVIINGEIYVSGSNSSSFDDAYEE